MNDFGRYCVRYSFLLGLASFLWVAPPPARGGVAEAALMVESGQLVLRSFRPLINVAGAVLEVPVVAAGVLRLPMGVVEVALCPLPGLSLSRGLRNFGKGLLAPFELTATVLKLPFRVVGELGKIVAD